MARLPNTVPLTQVTEYTEDITFGELWLPPDFDQERIQIRLHSLDRARSIGGLGHLSIVGVQGQGEERPIATGHANLKPTVNWIGVIFQTDVEGSVIKINVDRRDAELQGRNEQTLDKNVMLDPKVQAKYLNSSIRAGLKGACKEVNTDWGRTAVTGSVYGWLALFDAAVPIEKVPLVAATILVRPLLFGAASCISALESLGKNGREGLMLKERLSWYYQSFFFGANIDRLGLGISAAQLGRFVTARE